MYHVLFMIHGEEREVEILGKKMVLIGFSLITLLGDHGQHNQ